MKILDPNDRFLLCRPAGGFNDMLVQIAICRYYAMQYDRTLIIDTSYSGLRLPIDHIFSFAEDFGCKVFAYSDKIQKDLSEIKYVHPSAIKQKLRGFKIRGRWFKGQLLPTIGFRRHRVKFNLKLDHGAKLLIHHSSGGGPFAYQLLKKLKLKPNIASQLAERLRPLGHDYDAIHIRHSDYETDYESFFARQRDRFVGRRLLICSDSAEVKRRAESLLDPSTKILSVADIPEIGRQPLHATNELDPLEMAVDFLSDLFGMARSREYLFAKLTPNFQGTVTESGFSLLAKDLKERPDIIQNLFSLRPDGDLLDLFKHDGVASLKPQNSI